MSDESELLRLLTKNEQIARFFEQIAHLLIFLQKTTDEQIPSPGGQEKEWEVYQGYRNLLFCSFALRYFALGSLKKSDRIISIFT